MIRALSQICEGVPLHARRSARPAPSQYVGRATYTYAPLAWRRVLPSHTCAAGGGGISSAAHTYSHAECARDRAQSYLLGKGGTVMDAAPTHPLASNGVGGAFPGVSE